MRVTIEGDMDQVTDALHLSRRARRGEGRFAKANRIIAEQHAILRQAFELVRRDPSEKQLAETLLAALVGRAPRTETVLDTARQIIAQHS